ncbi:MAG: cell division protein SepF [Candidatus Micrarchaeota archaeon]|nr:cell division protein SepF [Candidatus Micrarchaeota archaeon]MDE1847321.1 cell division protein SepF [Candidatus Micrarchaeota archaeon]MDE1863936.1 cell division protein SepF [Candidatus Micrarchaeota archaeon]
MGIFDKLGQAMGVSKELSIEEYMGSAEMENVDILNEPADMYIKPVSITSEDDVKLIQDELNKKNIILLNIDEINKRPNTRNTIITSLKTFVAKINGDIAQIDESRIIITPTKVKIIKKKKPK